MVQNKGLIFKAIPTALPVVGEHLAVEAREIDLGLLPPPGGLLTKNLYSSFDPYLRGRMRDSKTKSYSQAYNIGESMTNGGIAKVLKSDCPKFSEGDLILVNQLPIEEYSILSKETMDGLHIEMLKNPYGLDPKIFLGALGMPGRTAYSAFYEIGKPVKGETIFVSAASGAVGQLVGQLAKHEGLTVIGSVGSDEKLDFILHKLNFDSGFNYKKESPSDALARLAPNGIDIYFDNVGGETLDAALVAMNLWGRIIACGSISQTSLPEDKQYGVKNLGFVIGKRLTMRGFIVFDKDMGPAYDARHQEFVSRWLHEGSLIASMSVTDGIDNAAEGLVGMLQGKNFGKAVLKIADA